MSTAFFAPTAPASLATDHDELGEPSPWVVERFVADEACTGPWLPGAMHGGPPSALLVRACEQVAAAVTGVRLEALRTSVEFLAPVLVGPIEVAARVLRPGRRIILAEARMSIGGRPVLLGRTWLLRTTTDDTLSRAIAELAADPLGRPPEPRHPLPEACPPAMTDWAFPYARAMEWRHVSGDPGGPGDAAAWARPRRSLVPEEPLTGLQRAVLVADSGNGISAALDWDRWSFVNVDLVVHLSRPLSGDWVLLDARTRYEPGGTGLATSVLHDQQGVIGSGAQSLLVSPIVEAP